MKNIIHDEFLQNISMLQKLVLNKSRLNKSPVVFAGEYCFGVVY